LTARASARALRRAFGAAYPAISRARQRLKALAFPASTKYAVCRRAR